MKSADLFRRGVKGLVLLFALQGCALQSSMVDIEDVSGRLRNHQLQLQRRIEKLERSAKAPSIQVKNQQALSAELIAQLGSLESDIRTFSGQVTESNHNVGTLENRMDAESFRTKELLNRLSFLEQRFETLVKRLPGNAAAGTDGKGNSRKRRASSRQNRQLSPREAFNLAYNDYVKGNYQVAILAFDSFLKHYPESRLVAQALYWKGESYYGMASYGDALHFFDLVIEKHPKSEKVSKALLKAGFAALELGKKDESKAYLARISRQFPSSNEAALAADAMARFEAPLP